MNLKAENAHAKIMLLFDSGGEWPLPEDKFIVISEHIATILERCFETDSEKKQRKWKQFQETLGDSTRLARR